MFYIDSLQTLVDISLTLGSEDTENPPALALSFTRKGTNESVLYVVPGVNVTPGSRYATISDIPTNIFEGTGQYDYVVYDYTVPGTPVEIESGLCIVTSTEITRPSYGTDRTRKEYKGS